MSPILFILTLDQLVQLCDDGKWGIKFGRILSIKVMGYPDDAVLVDETVEKMTARLTVLGDKSVKETDVHMNMDETKTQRGGSPPEQCAVSSNIIQYYSIIHPKNTILFIVHTRCWYFASVQL